MPNPSLRLLSFLHRCFQSGVLPLAVRDRLLDALHCFLPYRGQRLLRCLLPYGAGLRSSDALG
eukprot:9230793-Heterocapsa_arctica.AAC.1